MSMRIVSTALMSTVLALAACATPDRPTGEPPRRAPLVGADAIEERAAASAWVPLADDSELAPAGAVAFDDPGRVPNYLRALAMIPGAPQAFAGAFSAMLLEVVLQTANFAFMNRFTDNLGLPSEDEAIQVYREVYGGDWE